ncbi:hypothetical protein A5717_25290 [Mycolicibacterium porcinum]|uniref:FMN-binding negative transcriptional regulator n=1 Tax=Mycolicibacterium porcinum TaxID=39693 RepID=UPI00080BE3E8|nr:FMN-binding negative transcriptional regulator [Mycolicibacterium porcinum]OCB09107.1 hypothetical protein A5717_25290 [Mycolicibacterium porcinum]
MYQPAEFQDEGAVRAYAHIQRNPFGILVTGTGSNLSATHLPFLLDDDESPSGLVSHFAVRNDGLASVTDGEEVLTIFSGPHSYVSPTSYQVELDVPTWNYTAVHLYGRYRRVDQHGLRSILQRTVDRFERNNAETWSLDSLPAPVIRSLSRGVIGFVVETTRIQGGYKLSQDKLAEDFEAVRTSLAVADSPCGPAVAEEMRRTGFQGRGMPPTTDPDNWLGPA